MTFQLFTIGHGICISCNLSLLNIMFWFVCTSTELNFLMRSVYKFYFIFVSVWTYLGYFEVILLKFLTIYIWKRIPPIQDQYSVFFLALFNTFIGTLVSAMRFLTDENIAHDAEFMGFDKKLAPPPKLKVQ